MCCRERLVWVATLAVILGVVTATTPSLVADPAGHGTGVSRAATSPGATGPPGTVAPPGVAPRPVEPDRILIRIRVHPDGSASWTIEHRVGLEEENDEVGFERAREAVADNESELTAAMARRARELAGRAQEATGRTMVVENVSVTARQSLAGDQGIVAYRFRWYGFAGTDDGDLVIGDAMTGLILDERTTLQVSWPGETRAESIVPAPDERTEQSATWKGPDEFASGEPRIVVRSETVAFGTPEGPPDGGYENTLSVLGVVALVTLVLGGLVVRRRRDGEPSDSTSDAAEAGSTDSAPAGSIESTAGDSSGDVPATGATPGDPVETTPGNEPGVTADPSPTGDRTAAEDAPREETEVDGDTGENRTETGTDVQTADERPETPGGTKPETGAGESPGDDSGPAPEDLLSNEENVIQLLEDRGGRAKQQDVVEAFGWSETKTSEVVNEMREDDALEVYRLGRENVLVLPGESEFGIGGDDE